MSINTESLIQQILNLQRMVEQLSDEVTELRKENAWLREENAQLRQENARLKLKIEVLEKSKLPSAKPGPNEDMQTVFQMEVTESVNVEYDAPEDVPDLPSSTTRSKRKKRLAVDQKFDHLPISKETVLIPAEAKQQPHLWEEIGEEVTEELIVHPTVITRHRIIRKKLRSKTDRNACPIIAKAPIRFSSSFVSSSLATYLVLNKYLEHSTLYRLEKKFVRLGVELVRQTQSDIVERFSQWVRPLYELIHRRAIESAYLQIDETFIRFINGRHSGLGQGYFWAIQAPGMAMVYRWIADRRHCNVESLIGGFEGILQSDGYAAYSNFAKDHKGIVLAACWSHAFRKFRDAIEEEPAYARAVMKIISDMYDLEEEWNKQAISIGQRQQLRAEKSLPLALKLKQMLEDRLKDPNLLHQKWRTAVKYTLNHWEPLWQCLQHGHTYLDTNLLESKFRPIKIGEKNWMFIGHPMAGQKSAIIYTLLTCCRIHRIDPQFYLNDVLEKLIPQDHRPSAELLETLLPWNWAKANPQHLIKELDRA